MQSDCLLMEKDEHSASQLPLSLEYPCRAQSAIFFFAALFFTLQHLRSRIS